MKKQIIIIIILALLLINLSSFSLAQDPELERITRNLIIQEHKNTKQYFDQKALEAEKFMETEGQAFIDENFKILDAQVRKLANTMLIKMIVGIIASILCAHLLWYLIKNRIEGLRRQKSEKLFTKRKIGTFTQDEINKMREGEKKGILSREILPPNPP